MKFQAFVQWVSALVELRFDQDLSPAIRTSYSYTAFQGYSISYADSRCRHTHYLEELV